ncbi:uncharacterized protein [Rutidosis leptorrhynchoides]|uniref:uncharacterized protein n=1 Tax=Rutidosis leptorrhynchoides TaxID=125765 RepID=UPI003A992078
MQTPNFRNRSDDDSFSGESQLSVEIEDHRESSDGSDWLSDIDLESCVRDKVKRDCRICHLGLMRGNRENGAPIQLGCSCKGDLAAAHKKCAETWFKIKGNMTCEICGATALNVGGGHTNEMNAGNAATSITVAAPNPPVLVVGTRSFWNGRRIMNFLLACMIFAFIISWLFYYKIIS